MKHTTLVASTLLALAAPAAAQWSDNFEGYAANQVLQNVGGWFGWDNVPAAAGSVDSQRSRSFPNSLRVTGTTDAVRPALGATSGRWTLTAWQYIPAPQAGDLYFILNNVYNHGGPYSWTGQLKCAGGMVTDDMRPHTARPIVFDQWVQYRVDINLDTNTVAFFYNNQLVSQGTYASGTTPRALVNIDLFSTGGVCNWDDISLAWRGDSFETYTPPLVLNNVGGWAGWDNVPAVAASVDGTRARSMPNSLLVVGTTDAVRPLIGITSGRWVLTAWQYIAAPGGGELYFILNNVYNHGGPYSWTTQLKATGGVVTDDMRPHTARPIVFDQWVEYRIDIDLDGNTVAYHYNGQLVSQGTYAASGPRAIANIDLFSVGGTCNWDDISFVEASTAPCYETNLGTALALGDDQTVSRPLGFTFPYSGGSATTIGICSNGFIWLDGTQTNAAWTNSVASFLGSTIATPRISPMWRDLNPSAAGSDDVYFNAFPDRAVITWHQVVRFGGTVPMTVQCQLLSDGSVYFYYAGDIDAAGGNADSGRSLIGVKGIAGNVADPGNTDYTAALPVSTTVPTVYEFIGDSVNFDLRNRCIRFVPNLSGGYRVSFRNDCGAASSSYGAGCPTGTPLTLAASAPPRLGTTINLNVTNVAIGADIGAMLFGVNTMNVSLTPIGFPGCSVYTTMNLVAGLTLTPPTGTVPMSVPLTTALIGGVLNAQAAVVKNSAPTSTHASNGLALIFGKN